MLLLLGGVVSLEIEDYRRMATISKKRKKKEKKNLCHRLSITVGIFFDTWNLEQLK